MRIRINPVSLQPNFASLYLTLTIVLCLILVLGPVRRDIASAATIDADLELVTIRQNGEGLQTSGAPAYAMSEDGSAVLFMSTDADLVSNDTNTMGDLFVRNIRSDITKRVNVTSAGEQSEAGATVVFSAVSSSLRYVAFDTKSAVLFGQPQQTSVHHPYIHDVQTGTTARIQYPSGAIYDYSRIVAISDDGTYVIAKLKIGASGHKLYVHDRAANTWQRLASPLPGTSETNSPDNFQSSSCDGSVGLFTSVAPNLSPSDTNQRADLFLYDIRNGAYKIKNLTQDHTAAPANAGLEGKISISCSGDYVTYMSTDRTIVDNVNFASLTPETQSIYVYDRVTETHALVSQDQNGNALGESLRVPATDNGTLIVSKNGTYPQQRSYYTRNLSSNIRAALYDPVNTSNQLTDLDNLGLIGLSADGSKILLATARTDVTQIPVSDYYRNLYVAKLDY